MVLSQPSYLGLEILGLEPQANASHAATTKNPTATKRGNGATPNTNLRRRLRKQSRMISRETGPSSWFVSLLRLP